MVSIAKSIGMSLEGRRAAHHFRDGKWQDFLDFAIFADTLEADK
jgi:RimJ/RimL family protein N-acetyltransferase